MQILIVDDSKTILHVLGSLLREIGYDDVVDADNVEKAMQLCKKHPPSLIISDWNMPGASGLDFLKNIRINPETADIPFIILTTETDRGKIVEATKAGIQSYLLKPIKKQVLMEKLRELSLSYGFPPPGATGQSSVLKTQGIPDSDRALKGKIKKEHMASILDAYRKIWKNEMSISEFEVYVKIEVFGSNEKGQPGDVESLLQIIQDASREGILNRLIQLV